MVSEQGFFVRAVDEDSVECPSIEDGLGKFQAGVAGQRGGVQVAAVTDEPEDRQLVIMGNIAQSVAGFKQAGALDADDRPRAAEVQAGCRGPRLALATDLDELQFQDCHCL